MTEQTTLPATVPHGRFADLPIEAVPTHHQLWMLAMNASVSDKIARLLERTDKIKRGSQIDRPVRFDRDGERHARRIAEREASQPETNPRGVRLLQKMRTKKS